MSPASPKLPVALFVAAAAAFLARGTADLINDALRHETPIPEIHPHGKRYLHSMEKVDPLGGVIKFHYDVTVQHHVETLDEWPGLDSVECRENGELVMRGSSAKHLAQRIFDGSIVVGSEKWGCISKKGGNAAPFYFKVISSPVSYEGYIIVKTKPTTFDSCFTHINTHMSRSPGQFEQDIFAAVSDLERSKYLNDTGGQVQAARRLQKLGRRGRRLWGWVSDAVSAVADAVTTVVEVVKSAAEEIADGFDFEWGATYFEEYALVKWNFDSWNRKPMETSTPFSRELLCDNCYAYIGANMKFEMNMNWWKLQNMELSAFAGILLGIDISLETTDGIIEGYKWMNVKERETYKRLKYVLGVVPVTIDIDGQVDVGTSLKGSKDSKVVGPGFWVDQSITVGVAFDVESGWRLIKERSAVMKTRKPYIDLRDDLSLRVALENKVIFSIYGVWGFAIAVHPYIQVDLTPSGCTGWRRVKIDTYLGVDGQISIEAPVVNLEIPRTCLGGLCLGPYGKRMELNLGDIFPIVFDFTILGKKYIYGPGISGCRTRRYRKGSRPGWGSSSSSKGLRRLSGFDYADEWDAYDERKNDWDLLDAFDEDAPARVRVLQVNEEPTTEQVCGSRGCALHTSDWSECNTDCGIGVRTREITCQTNNGDGTVVDDRHCETDSSGSPVARPAAEQDCSSTCLNLDSNGNTPFAHVSDRAERRRMRHVIFPGAGHGVRLNSTNRYRGCLLMQEGDNAVDARLFKTEGNAQMSLEIYGMGEDKADPSGMRNSFAITRSYDSQLSAMVTSANDRLTPSSRVYVFARHIDPNGEVEFKVQATSYTQLQPGMAVQVVTVPQKDQIGTAPEAWPPGIAEADLPFSIGLCADIDFTKPWLYDGTLEAMGFDSSTLDMSAETAVSYATGNTASVDLTQAEANYNQRMTEEMAGQSANQTRNFMLYSGEGTTGILFLAATAEAAYGELEFDDAPIVEVVQPPRWDDGSVAPLDLPFDFQCHNKDESGWPSEENPGKWSAVQSPADAPGVLSLIISGDEYTPGSYACSSVVSEMGFGLGVIGMEISDLNPGETAKYNVPALGYRLFRAKVSATASAARISLRSTVGDANLYVHHRMFRTFPRNDWMWRSKERAGIVDEVVVSSLDTYYSEELWIAVYAQSSAEFEISLQAYERLEQGDTVRRSLESQGYNYFVGTAPESGGSGAERSFNLRVHAPPDAPTTMGMYAGSHDSFFPVVGQGFSGISVEGIGQGHVAAAERPYLAGSEIAQQMIIATRSDFHDSTRPGDTGNQQGTSIADMNSQAERRRLLIDAYNRTMASPAAVRRAMALSEAFDGLARPSFVEEEEMLFRKTTQGGGLRVTYPDIEWAPLLGEAPVPGQVEGGAGRRLEARGAGLTDAQHHQRNLAQAIATRRMVESIVASTKVPEAVHSGRELMPTDHGARVEQGTASRWVSMQSETPHSVVQRHASTRALRRLNSGSSGSSDSDSWKFQVPFDRFQGGFWRRVLNCSVTVGDVVSRQCALVQADQRETTHLRLMLPARSDMLVSVATVTRTGEASDAAYTMRVRAGQPPAAGMTDLEAVTATQTFTVPNCAYEEEELYIAVEGQNSGRDVQFQVLLAGTLSVNGVCESYEWASTAWRACDVECGEGTRRRAVWCQTTGGTVVDSSLCSKALKPAEAETCDVGECAWSSSGWGACSEPCGGGEQSRLLECRNRNGDGRLVLDAHCADPPLGARVCNTQECSTRFWYAGEWYACTQRCGGGMRSREVLCAQRGPCTYQTEDGRTELCAEQRSENWHVVDEGLCDRNEKPAVEEACGTDNCRALEYDLNYFDSVALVSGTSEQVALAPGQNAFFSFEKPNAATRGVCVRAQSFEPEGRKCSIEAERRVGACNSVLLGCLHTAKEAYPGATTGARPQYAELKNAVTQCHGKHLQCVSNDICNDRVEAVVEAAKESCMTTLEALGELTSTSTWTDAEPMCTVAASTADQDEEDSARELLLHVAKAGSSPDDPVLRFEPPVGPASSDWASHSPDKTGEQRMMIWETDGYDREADRILVGLAAPKGALRATIRVQALSAFPVQASGSLLGGSDGTVTAEQIRSGGLYLELTLSCDLFVDPAELAAKQRAEAGLNETIVSEAEIEARKNAGTLTIADVDALKNQRTMTPNMLLLGINARESSSRGWNSLAQPAIMYGEQAADDLVRFSFGMTRATVTLPPVPDYNPNGDENLHIAIPALMLRSGVKTAVPDTTIKVLSDMADCQVGPWGPWSECDAVCSDGVQRRQRQVLRAPRGEGSACPVTMQTRDCNTCDQCSTRSCLNGGLCVQGQCHCKPGYFGAGCEAPPRDPDAVYYYTVGEWGQCTAQCDGGRQVREVGCARLSWASAQGTSRADATAVAVDVCIQQASIAGPMPAEERACNAFACEDEARVDGSTVLQLPAGSLSLSLGDGDATDALINDLQSDLSRALFVSARRVRIDTIELEGVAADGSEHARLNFTLLPISGATFGSDTDSSSEAGARLETVTAELKRQVQDPASVLRTRGTYLRRMDPTTVSLEARQGVTGTLVPLQQQQTPTAAGDSGGSTTGSGNTGGTTSSGGSSGASGADAAASPSATPQASAAASPAASPATDGGTTSGVIDTTNNNNNNNGSDGDEDGLSTAIVGGLSAAIVALAVAVAGMAAYIYLRRPAELTPDAAALDASSTASETSNPASSSAATAATRPSSAVGPSERRTAGNNTRGGASATGYFRSQNAIYRGAGVAAISPRSQSAGSKGSNGARSGAIATAKAVNPAAKAAAGTSAAAPAARSKDKDASVPSDAASGSA